uniref:Uncharacterized protein n=1 Tax=Eptatretus burgeri TaxID=7764 RepID=A0A8C4Q2Q2_EPTBU
MSRIQEKNKYIREILADLGIQAVESASKPGDLESVWEPEMTEDEVPERVFVVQDWEVEMALSFTAEQKAQREETLKRNDDGKSIAQADNRRLQGLMDMMWGILELKKENVLKMEIPEPSCMSKPEEEWTVEDHHQMKDFNHQVKELNDKKEKYRNVLQDELKVMHSAIIEYCQSFDRALTCLFDKKIKIEMAIHQEELKLANLSNSLLLEDELNCREVQLNFMRQQKKQLKEQSAQLLLEAKERVENFRETYTNLVTGDKELERGFRREFPDLQSSIIDNLFKMYKHRPRAQKVRTLALSADPYAERPSSRSGTGTRGCHTVAPDDGGTRQTRVLPHGA